MYVMYMYRSPTRQFDNLWLGFFVKQQDKCIHFSDGDSDLLNWRVTCTFSVSQQQYTVHIRYVRYFRTCFFINIISIFVCKFRESVF